MDDNRTLTEADVKAIAQQVEREITERFQLNVGRGVLRMVWRVVLHTLIIMAAYGAGGGFKKFL